VGSRPPTPDKQKTEKSKALLLCFYNKKKLSTFFCFLLAKFEAGGNRPQTQELRTSVSRLGSQSWR
ncbi:MAG: hypothetical protein MSA20_08325, partial [Bacteroidales bacterium]|nr:hypothetical protein [Bacteroidales bacterium]